MHVFPRKTCLRTENIVLIWNRVSRSWNVASLNGFFPLARGTVQYINEGGTVVCKQTTHWSHYLREHQHENNMHLWIASTLVILAQLCAGQGKNLKQVFIVLLQLEVNIGITFFAQISEKSAMIWNRRLQASVRRRASSSWMTSSCRKESSSPSPPSSAMTLQCGSRSGDRWTRPTWRRCRPETRRKQLPRHEFHSYCSGKLDWFRQLPTPEKTWVCFHILNLTKTCFWVIKVIREFTHPVNPILNIFWCFMAVLS